MKQTTIKHHMDGLWAMLLFGAFAICIMVVLLSGAQAYSSLTQRDQAAYAQRTAVQYVATRVRQADAAGAISLRQLGDAQALALGQDYQTLVYYYDGYIMELYAEAGAEFAPEDGERVLPVAGMAFQLNGQWLNVTLTDEAGQTQKLQLALRSAAQPVTQPADDQEEVEL